MLSPIDILSTVVNHRRVKIELKWLLKQIWKVNYSLKPFPEINVPLIVSHVEDTRESHRMLSC